jgi:hypothetical protein
MICRLSIRYNGVELAYRTFDKIRQVDQGAIADNKRRLFGPCLPVSRSARCRRTASRSNRLRDDFRLSQYPSFDALDLAGFMVLSEVETGSPHHGVRVCDRGGAGGAG